MPEVELFSGEANPAQARVYVRLAAGGEEILHAGRMNISGRLIGPFCEFAHTLSARMPFMERKANGAMLLEAIVPDPCFWTPDLPNLYRAHLEIAVDDQPVQKIERAIGIRRIGVKNNSLLFDGKRFVLRAVRAMNLESGQTTEEESQISTAQIQLHTLQDEIIQAFARETWTALVVPWPAVELCELASRRGIILVADLRGPSTAIQRNATQRNPTEVSIEKTLRLLSQWPAIALAILDRGIAIDRSSHSGIHNLLLAEHFPAGTPIELSPWANLAIVESQSVLNASQNSAVWKAPVVVENRLSDPQPIEQARAACDRLQSELARCGDFAGYMV